MKFCKTIDPYQKLLSLMAIAVLWAAGLAVPSLSYYTSAWAQTEADANPQNGTNVPKTTKLLTPAEFPSVTKIAVIDMQRAEQGTKVWQNYQSQAEVLIAAYQKDAREAQQALEDEKRDLDSQKTLLSLEAFNQRSGEFSRKAQTIQRNFIIRKQALDNALGEARQAIQKVLNRVLVELAVEYKFDLVLRRTSSDQAVVISRDILEISPLVIDRVDRVLTQIKVADPSTISSTDTSKESKP